MSLKIQVIGGPFVHAVGTTPNLQSDLPQWTLEESNIKMYVDLSIPLGLGSGKENKYALICETKAINPDLYKWCLQEVDSLRESYTYVFTHYVELL